MSVPGKVPREDVPRPVPGVVLTLPPLLGRGEARAGRAEDEESGLVLALVVERDEIVLPIAGDVVDRELRATQAERVRALRQPDGFGKGVPVGIGLADGDLKARVAGWIGEERDLRLAVASEVAACGHAGADRAHRMGRLGGRNGRGGRCRGRLRQVTRRSLRLGRSGAGDEDRGGERKRTRDDRVTLKQSAPHHATTRTLRASRLETDADLACRAGDQGFLRRSCASGRNEPRFAVREGALPSGCAGSCELRPRAGCAASSRR